MKLGILGGTFNPPHIGHLEIAREALEELELDKIIFMVAGSPQLKNNPVITPAEQRLAMTRLAVEGENNFEVSSLEIEREGATYTVETLAELRHAGAGNDELFFIIGMDNLKTLKFWHKPEEIIKECTLVVVPRPGGSEVDISRLEKDIPGISQKLIILKKPFINISASQIRKAVNKKQPISHLVPVKVEEYIKAGKLYL
ncbi:MAG: nicotinate-nucleotide adenylyltransferase [Dehalococcoidales bacterium]|nr:nicotinate-nucleotide adenylyltransferase [Dehalococcoidales bacterium]